MGGNIKILIGIVLYKTNLTESKTYLSLIKALDNFTSQDIIVKLMITDNSPDIIKNDINEIEYYYHFKKNPGLSYCYNKMIAVAEKYNFDFINFFDQDTVLPKDYFSILSKNIMSNNSNIYASTVLQNSSNILISPYKNFHGKGFHLKNINWKESFYNLKDFGLINSGLLIRTTFFRKSGLYNPYLKLDLSDNYFLREAKKYTDTFFLMKINLTHSLSSLEKSSKENSLIRFTIYLKAIKIYCKNNKEKFILISFAFLRSVKLSLRYFSIKFILNFFKIIFTSKDFTL